jgi:RHS repeat-associated protein
MSIEQINNSTDTVTYLDHDQAATRPRQHRQSRRECAYSAHGTPPCEGTATTPLGFDGQYTSTDIGLIYIRNRVYDPTTAQFLSVDPAAHTRALRLRGPYLTTSLLGEHAA